MQNSLSENQPSHSLEQIENLDVVQLLDSKTPQEIIEFLEKQDEYDIHTFLKKVNETHIAEMGTKLDDATLQEVADKLKKQGSLSIEPAPGKTVPNALRSILESKPFHKQAKSMLLALGSVYVKTLIVERMAPEHVKTGLLQVARENPDLIKEFLKMSVRFKRLGSFLETGKTALLEQAPDTRELADQICTDTLDAFYKKLTLLDPVKAESVKDDLKTFIAAQMKQDHFDHNLISEKAHEFLKKHLA